jgi:hypothetical protein
MWITIRLAVLISAPLFFWAAWYTAPALLEAEGLKWLSGLVALLWGLEFYFFRRLSEVSNVQGITTKEHERLVLRLTRLRKRVWWIWWYWVCLLIAYLVIGGVEVARHFTFLCESGRHIGWHQHFIPNLNTRMVKRNTRVHR